MQVAYLDSTFCRFLAVSLAIHLIALLYWLKLPLNMPVATPIRVALLPPQGALPDKPQVDSVPSPAPPKAAARIRLPKEPAARLSKAPAIIAKKASPLLDEKPVAPPEKIAPKDSNRVEPVAPKEFQEDPIFTERSLPILKELLPSPGQTNKDNNSPIPLNTSDPKYKTYLQDVQQIIDANWQYPELALQYGLQGTVVIEFIILENGRVDGLRLIRSSGFRLLDEEVFRAITASSPFRRLPPWMESKRLWVSATMEYHDGRFKAWLAR
jgi:periplasmic protein TonB